MTFFLSLLLANVWLASGALSCKFMFEKRRYFAKQEDGESRGKERMRGYRQGGRERRRERERERDRESARRARARARERKRR